MSSETLAQVVTRMMRDASFRRSVQADPMTALADYDLTEEEKRSLAGGLGSLDVSIDQRITKARGAATITSPHGNCTD